LKNLDAMTPEDLWAFWGTFKKGAKRSNCATLIGDKRKGYTTLANDLACYASNKATAIKCRLDGCIDSALIYESICERIYNNLPIDLRW
jgi:hypothetical protein